jgi:predicted HTH transcriptional regulator
MISGGCEPQIDVDIQQITYQNQPLIIVKVKKGLDKLYLVKEKTAYKRIDERDIQMNRHDLDEIYNQKQRR